MKVQLLTMLELQDQMNQKVHSDWKSQNFPWYRAIWIESAELMEHFGWKWWKKQTEDREQVVLELIDIWHFGLSSLLQEADDLEALAEQLCSELQFVATDKPFLTLVEDFVADVVTTKSFSVKAFIPMLVAMDVDFSQLYRSYVGKNVLNFFRQDHGYKEGAYLKLWQGREDNEHLVELVQQLDSNSTSFKDDLYLRLKARYEESQPA